MKMKGKYHFMKISDCTLDLRNITLKNYQSVYDEGSDGAINLKSGKLNVINGELRTLVYLMKYYNLPAYRLQYIIFRTFNTTRHNII